MVAVCVCVTHHCSSLFLGALEGTLGKIASLSSRNPRQSLQVSDKKTNHSDETSPVTPEQTSSHDHAHLATVSFAQSKKYSFVVQYSRTVLHFSETGETHYSERSATCPHHRGRTLSQSLGAGTDAQTRSLAIKAGR